MGRPSIHQPEVKEVDTHRVSCAGASCDGEGGISLGHPRVFLEIGKAGFVECPYCDCRFQFRKDAKPECRH